MSARNLIYFWTGALAVLSLAIYLLSNILLPFVGGLALAYLFDPLARRLEARGSSRAVAAFFIIGLFVLFFLAALLLLLPIAARELIAFVQRLPQMIARLQAILADQFVPALERMGIDASRWKGGEGALADAMRQSSNWLLGFLQSLWSSGQAIADIVSLVLIMPFVAYYLLRDWPIVLAKLEAWTPRYWLDTVRALTADIDKAIAGFIRGQAIICLLLGLFYAVALALTGLNFGILIGLMCGLFGFVPYVGALVGLVVATLVAISQFWPDWSMIVLIFGIFALGQIVEGSFLQPKLVGEAVGLHPVWLMFALLAFGKLGGLVGLIAAVPISAAIGVVARYGLSAYLRSPYYLVAAAKPVAAAEPGVIDPTAQRNG